MSEEHDWVKAWQEGEEQMQPDEIPAEQVKQEEASVPEGKPVEAPTSGESSSPEPGSAPSETPIIAPETPQDTPSPSLEETSANFKVGVNEDSTGIQAEFTSPKKLSTVELADQVITGLFMLVVQQGGNPKITMSKMFHVLKMEQPETYKMYFEKSNIITNQSFNPGRKILR